jgi:hypothetical protein
MGFRRLPARKSRWSRLIGHVPRAPGRFGGVDHAIAIEAALLGHHITNGSGSRRKSIGCFRLASTNNSLAEVSKSPDEDLSD